MSSKFTKIYDQAVCILLETTTTITYVNLQKIKCLILIAYCCNYTI